MNNNTLARQLKKLRTQKGISQHTLAELCGISRATVQRYENGKRIPNVEILAIIADYFGVSIDELYLQKQERQYGA